MYVHILIMCMCVSAFVCVLMGIILSVTTDKNNDKKCHHPDNKTYHIIVIMPLLW